MNPLIEGTSAAEHTESGERTQIEGTSAAEHTDPFEVERGYTSASENPQIEEISAAEHTGSGEKMQIEGTSAAEHTNPFEVEREYTSSPDDLQIQDISVPRRRRLFEMGCEYTSYSEDLLIEEISAAEHTDPFEEISDAESIGRVLSLWETNSIFRASAPIRFGRESNFKPKLVSIGPYYHGEEDLQRMEDFKHRSMLDLWKQGIRLRKRGRSTYHVPVKPSTKGGRDIDDVPHEQFMDLEGRARAYYKHEVNHGPVNFVRMLVLDSFFIIRTIFSLSEQVQQSGAIDLGVHIKEIRSDLLLLENQIPLFFIREVYEWLFPGVLNGTFPTFETVLQPFICFDMSWRINHDGMSSKAAHFLDLYWRCSLPPPMYNQVNFSERYPSELERDISEQIENLSECSEVEGYSWAENSLSNNALMVIANATELQKMAGIEFEKFKDKGHLDVTFSNGIMRMPRLKIDSRQTTLLVNLIAFENSIIPTWRIFSSYMKLMDALIDSEEDVNLLQKCGLIYNTLSSHETAATFFNDIGNFCFIDYNTNRFSGLHKDVQKYYNSSWHRRWANLQQNYFSSPWSVISVIAGVTLLILSALQTFYTIYGYYKPKN